MNTRAIVAKPDTTTAFMKNTSLRIWMMTMMNPECILSVSITPIMFTFQSVSIIGHTTKPTTITIVSSTTSLRR